MNHVQIKKEKNVEEVLKPFNVRITKMQTNYNFLKVRSIKATLKHFVKKDFLIILITILRCQKILQLLKKTRKGQMETVKDK